MILCSWTTNEPIRNLPKLLEAYNSRGGTIVAFQRVVSIFFFSQKSTRYVWVPPNGIAVLRSLPDTLISLLCGWWSLYGFFWTIGALITNLSGGRDATAQLLEATWGGNVERTRQALDEELKERRRHSIWSLFLFAGLVGGVALFAFIMPKIAEWQTGGNNAKPAVANGQAPARASVRSPGNNNSAPPAMRLQAIFYNSNGRSTAMVDGKTVSVGDRVGGCTVKAIEQQSISLQSANGRAKVLHMSNDAQ